MFNARARGYQVAPNLARVCRLDVHGAESNSLDGKDGRHGCGAGGLCGERVVLVEQTTEPVTATDLVRRRRLRRWRFGERWALLERAVRSVLVVMSDVGAHDLLELTPADDQEPVEALTPQAAHPALGVRLRFRRLHWCADHADPLGAEDLVEAARELAVAAVAKRVRSPTSSTERSRAAALSSSG